MNFVCPYCDNTEQTRVSAAFHVCDKERWQAKIESLRTQNAELLAAQKSFAASLADRIAALEFERKHATKAKQLIINREIGLIQAIAHDYKKQQQETL